MAISWIFGMPTDSFLFREVFIFATSSHWFLNLNGGIQIQESGVAEYMYQRFIFQFFWKIKKKKKTEVTLSMILRFNLRLGGYSIWSASTSRTIYDQDFRAWAPRSLEANGSTWRTTRRIWRKDQKQPEGYSDFLKYSKTPSQVLNVCRTRLRRARGLVRPGAAGLLIDIECSRVRNSSWMYFTSLVSTRIGVELAAV